MHAYQSSNTPPTKTGQMETKMFEIDMPESATMEAWRGVTAKIMLLVRRRQAVNRSIHASFVWVKDWLV